MNLETELINYGVLGFWTLTLLVDKVTYQKKIKEVIDNNTKAMTLFLEKCK